jgi:hypothetical protein
MDENPHLAEEPGCSVGQVIRLLLGLLVGCALGWFTRAHTSGDRYITALASRMIAEASYFNNKTDQMIQDNERKYKK